MSEGWKHVWGITVNILPVTVSLVGSASFRIRYVSLPDRSRHSRANYKVHSSWSKIRIHTTASSAPGESCPFTFCYPPTHPSFYLGSELRLSVGPGN